jgi:hypothetical protein
VTTDSIHVVCYNENYPRMIELETASLLKYGRIRMGEVMNLLPPGIELDRNMHKNLNFSVIKMSELEENKLFDHTLLFDNTKFREDNDIAVTFIEKFRTSQGQNKISLDKTDDTTSEMSEVEMRRMPVSSETPPEKKKKIHNHNRVFSVKEKIKALGLEINPELAEMDTKGKKGR